MIVYTLKNCDTCKKALKWLDAQGADYTNHDIRADGVDISFIKPIVEAASWETALNRRSTSWRGLNDDEKSDVDNAKAVELILAHPTLMKRPVFVSGSKTIVGFDAKAQTTLQSLL